MTEKIDKIKVQKTTNKNCRKKKIKMLYFNEFRTIWLQHRKMKVVLQLFLHMFVFLSCATYPSTSDLITSQCFLKHPLMPLRTFFIQLIFQYYSFC